MSYILEALKKAEAERQLGATPTIHATTLEAAAPRTSGVRKPLVAVLGGMAVVIVVLGVVVWRQASAPAVTPVAAQPVVAAAPVRTPPIAPRAAPTVATPQPAPVVTATPTPPAPAARPESVSPPPARVAAASAPAPKPAEEPAQALNDLPEPIRRAIPTYTMDGYMYSANPADRMVLIDKVLRREGEEVAPGLVLEKLLPKGAVFSFRGYRYRVAF